MDNIGRMRAASQAAEVQAVLYLFTLEHSTEMAVSQLMGVLVLRLRLAAGAAADALRFITTQIILLALFLRMQVMRETLKEEVQQALYSRGREDRCPQN